MTLPPVFRPRFRAGGIRAAVLAGCVCLLLWAPPRARAQASDSYVPCLGCAEHAEMSTRWHRPFLAELAGEGMLLFSHFQVEGEAERMGLCESDGLIRNPIGVNGCHAFSAARAWLIETPLEIVAFTSPAWGLERRGHPRWAMALEAVPMVYHGLATRHTIEAIHDWEREQALYH